MSMVAENMKMIAECSKKLIELCEKLGMVEEEKTKYPKTYDECAEMMGIVWDWHLLSEFESKGNIQKYERRIDYKLSRFKQLLICRDAYWKLAGDWKPDYDSGVDKLGICTYDGVVQKSNAASHWERHLNKVLEFPTKEMRDAFYENFKDLIEECKELL